MSFLADLFQSTIGRILPLSPSPTQQTKKRKLDNDNVYDSKRRHAASDDRSDVITKRRRVDNEHFAPIVNGEAYESTNFTTPSHTVQRQISDRLTMPPPKLSATRSKPRTIQSPPQLYDPAAEVEQDSQLSVTSKSTRQRLDIGMANEYDMEKARRHAAATTLPANSGIWERGEKELFYHLSYRGFEPLLPGNWMKDFPTLPLTLYQRESDQLPLIQNHRTTQFRAIRELRELLELGKDVRDKVLASPDIKREVIIEKAVNKYISWALADVDIKLPMLKSSKKKKQDTCLPIHIMNKLKPGQSTTACLMELKHKLHTLAAWHREARDVLPTVERDVSTDEDDDGFQDETRIIESNEDDLPVLYGIMICRSIMAIFTMNSHTPLPAPDSDTIAVSYSSPTPLGRPNMANNYSADVNGLSESMIGAPENSGEEDDTASDPRFIADFDFSDPAKDVWNALVVAIIAMQIRRDMQMAAQNDAEAMQSDGQMDVEHDDPDA